MKMLFTWFASFLFFVSILAATSRAQSPKDGQGVDASPAVTVHAEFFVNEKSRIGELAVTASLRDGYHIYAMTQPKPFLATKIHVESSDQVEGSDSFTPSRPPLMVRHDSIDVELHEYEGSITWTAALRLTGDVDLRTVEISGEIFAQACDARGCLPPKWMSCFRSWATKLAPSRSTPCFPRAIRTNQFSWMACLRRPSRFSTPYGRPSRREAMSSKPTPQSSETGDAASSVPIRIAPKESAPCPSSSLNDDS
jgi:hypothetical protein